MIESASWPMTFAEAFCGRFGCRADRYETAVLVRCLACRLTTVGRLIGLVRPTFFNDDRDSIRRLGQTRSVEDFVRELDDLDYVTQRRGGFVRLRLGMRVSVSRLHRLQIWLFSEPRHLMSAVARDVAPRSGKLAAASPADDELEKSVIRR